MAAKEFCPSAFISRGTVKDSQVNQDSARFVQVRCWSVQDALLV